MISERSERERKIQHKKTNKPRKNVFKHGMKRISKAFSSGSQTEMNKGASKYKLFTVREREGKGERKRERKIVNV